MSRRLGWAGHIARTEEGRSTFKILTSRSAGKRPRRRWESNIRLDIKEIYISIRGIWLFQLRIGII